MEILSIILWNFINFSSESNTNPPILASLNVFDSCLKLIDHSNSNIVGDVQKIILKIKIKFLNDSNKNLRHFGYSQIY